MKLVVGLGNVGSQYAKTRHNIGFMVVDQLAASLNGTWKTETKFKAATAEVQIGDERVLLAKPQTMMNLSGEAVQKLMQFYKIAPEDVWVAFDDVDVPFGRLRLRQSGASGQQGVRSVVQHVGQTFMRIRLGISLNDRATEPSEVYVLKPFKPEEAAQLPTLIARAAHILATELGREQPEDHTFDLLASDTAKPA